MFLTYQDLIELFPNSRGIKDRSLSFHTVASMGGQRQLKGIFIPLSDESAELRDAIANGAIAAIWDEKKEIPKYTPNHFPIFFTNDLLMGLRKMLFKYKELIQEGDIRETEKTNFLFLDEKLLKEFYETYDIAVIEEKWTEIISELSCGGKE